MKCLLLLIILVPSLAFAGDPNAGAVGAGGKLQNMCLGAYSVTTDTAETGSTATSIVATANAAQAGDVIRFTSGTLSGTEMTVATVSTNAINLQGNFNSAPANGDAFTIYRPKTLLTDSTGAVSTTTVVSSSSVAGDVAHDAPDSGNPVKVGSKHARTIPAVVADGDRTNSISDRFGRILTETVDPTWQGWAAASYTTAQTGAALWTPASGKRLAISYYNIGSAGTTACRATLWFGASGDTTYTEGTDKVIFDGTILPTAAYIQPQVANLAPPIFALTFDDVLRVTTSANCTVRIQTVGYEFTP